MCTALLQCLVISHFSVKRRKEEFANHPSWKKQSKGQNWMQLTNFISQEIANKMQWTKYLTVAIHSGTPLSHLLGRKLIFLMYRERVILLCIKHFSNVQRRSYTLCRTFIWTSINRFFVMKDNFVLFAGKIYRQNV